MSAEKMLHLHGGALTPARSRSVGLGVVRSCVHVNVHLHLIVQDLHELLHGWQVTRLQLGPHWHICSNATLLSIFAHYFSLNFCITTLQLK